MIEVEFEKARVNLHEFVLEQAASLGAYNGVGFLAHPTAPDTFDGILTEYKLWEDGYPFRVSPDHCENTIYTSPNGNHAFRFWHDVLHARHGHDLTLQGESAVNQMHINAVRHKFGSDSNEALLMQVDTNGQLMYFHEHGKHVDNQLEFAKGLLVARYGVVRINVQGVSAYTVERKQGIERTYMSDGLGIRLLPFTVAHEVAKLHRDGIKIPVRNIVWTVHTE